MENPYFITLESSIRETLEKDGHTLLSLIHILLALIASNINFPFAVSLDKVIIGSILPLEMCIRDRGNPRFSGVRQCLRRWTVARCVIWEQKQFL